MSPSTLHNYRHLHTLWHLLKSQWQKACSTMRQLQCQHCSFIPHTLKHDVKWKKIRICNTSKAQVCAFAWALGDTGSQRHTPSTEMALSLCPVLKRKFWTYHPVSAILAGHQDRNNIWSIQTKALKSKDTLTCILKWLGKEGVRWLGQKALLHYLQ